MNSMPLSFISTDALIVKVSLIDGMVIGINFLRNCNNIVINEYVLIFSFKKNYSCIYQQI